MIFFIPKKMERKQEQKKMVVILNKEVVLTR